MEINLKCTIETRTFKNGPMDVLVLKLTKNSEKIVFLTSAEMELLKLSLREKDEFIDSLPDLG